MSRDIYASWSGAQAAWQQLEVVAGNVANASTPGYREQRVSFSLAGGPGPLEGAMTQTQTIGWSQADGETIQDGNATHLAVRGEGFFALRDGSFTRDGSFRMNGEHKLVTRDGVPVLADGAPVQLEPGETFTVSENGTVIGSQSGELAKLSIVRLANPTPMGGNRWTGNGTPVESPTVVQGALEGSNVDVMRGMVELITAQRFFEAQQKAMQSSDDLCQRLDRMRG